MNTDVLRAEILRLRWQLVLKEIEIRQLRDVLSAVTKPPPIGGNLEQPEQIEPLPIDPSPPRRVRSPLVATLRTIKVGEGFTYKAGALRTSIHNLARKNGIKIQTTKIAEGEYTIVRIK